MSKHNVQYSVESDALRMGFVKKRSGPDFRQIRWELKCSKCPREFAASWDGGMKPEAMARHMRVRHWDVDYGMRPLCPDCMHSKDKAPLAKPEHQNFKPWVPPRTQMFDKILIAAEERAHNERQAHNIEVVMDLNQAVADQDAEVKELKAVRRATRATEAEEERKARHSKRISEAMKQHHARRKQTKIASEEALRVAQLKQRACGTVTDSSNLHIQDIPQEAPQAEEEVVNMLTTPKMPTPSPKITHAVFQLLDACFDASKRLYKSGYTDQRVARDCGTSEDVVSYLRTETFGALAEDPRIGSIRDDIELLGMDAAEKFAALQKSLGELRSRIEQVARK